MSYGHEGLCVPFGFVMMEFSNQRDVDILRIFPLSFAVTLTMRVIDFPSAAFDLPLKVIKYVAGDDFDFVEVWRLTFG